MMFSDRSVPPLENFSAWFGPKANILLDKEIIELGVNERGNSPREYNIFHEAHNNQKFIS